MTAAGFSFAVTCQACGGPLELTRVDNTRQTRRATTTCTDCGTRWTITVSMARTATLRAAPTCHPRLPWAPLARRLPAHTIDAAAHLGVDARTIARYRNDGVPTEDADRLAVAAGTTPTNVWGTAYYVACGDIEPDPDALEVYPDALEVDVDREKAA